MALGTTGLLVAGGDETGVVQTHGLAGMSWRVEIFNQKVIAAHAPVTLSVNGDGQANGSAGCNRYFAAFQQCGTRLTFASVGSTKKLCPPSIMASERKYLAALEQVRNWRVEKGKLLLSLENSSAVARLVKSS